MSLPAQIRVIALGLIQDKQQRILVYEGYDPVKQRSFYRALGGGVDFGETSLAALQREFQEELRAELANIRYLACLENIFTYNGKPGHELVQLYQCDLADPQLYELESLAYYEGEDCGTAVWIAGDRFKSGELQLVPEACIQYL